MFKGGEAGKKSLWLKPSSLENRLRLLWNSWSITSANSSSIYHFTIQQHPQKAPNSHPARFFHHFFLHLYTQQSHAPSVFVKLKEITIFLLPFHTFGFNSNFMRIFWEKNVSRGWEAGRGWKQSSNMYLNRSIFSFFFSCFIVIFILSSEYKKEKSLQGFCSHSSTNSNFFPFFRFYKKEIRKIVVVACMWRVRGDVLKVNQFIDVVLTLSRKIWGGRVASGFTHHLPLIRWQIYIEFQTNRTIRGGGRRNRVFGGVEKKKKRRLRSIDFYKH